MVRGLLPFPMKLLTEYVYSGKFVLFSRPDYTVGTGIPPAINTGGHRFSRFERVADFYRRLGLTPDPEDFIPFTLPNITLCKNDFKVFLSFWVFFFP